jgi:hypothetical protein
MIQDSVVDMGVHLMVIMMKTVIYLPPLSFRSSLYHPKERVIGVEFDSEFKAYPFGEWNCHS